ncbi:GNAT family N-acetyltransferase [Cohnella faecalis]|uniref:GNAT family N-acetyltransferase n=1 Tax=Cohnella faecalis TaxID=2315694 RepID=A0A398CXZ3_9BACL|nr:GNAT family N-acetyltransferase [Cohnella faecalis]
MTKLLHHALRKNARSGQTISMLHPFSVPFYRKYGMSADGDEKAVHDRDEAFSSSADVPDGCHCAETFGTAERRVRTIRCKI